MFMGKDICGCPQKLFRKHPRLWQNLLQIHLTDSPITILNQSHIFIFLELNGKMKQEVSIIPFLATRQKNNIFYYESIFFV